MTTSPNLDLPYLLAAQAQKHVTHNEAIRALDAIVHLAVKDRHLTAPPASPTNGDRYIVAASPTGAWSGRAGAVAAWQDGAWVFYTPREGWVAWVDDEDALVAWDGSAWVTAGGGVATVNPTPLVGVNATADATNRLSVSSPASLFNHAGAGHQQKINKNAAGDTASVLFQTGFSGRAEFGLTGDDDWHVKVSADGSVWREALMVDRTNGRVSMPLTPQREVLTAARTYYVRIDGNDANTGLVDNAGGAFRTIQKAINVVYGTIDLQTFTVTIQVRAGTYNEGLLVTTARVGSGNVLLLGDMTTPSNVVIQPTAAASAMRVGGGGTIDMRGFRVGGFGGFSTLVANYGTLFFGNMEFVSNAGAIHLEAASGGHLQCVANYTIVGGAAYHARAFRGGHMLLVGFTVTLTGTPAFSVAFAQAAEMGRVIGFGATYSGAATGKRYDVGTLGLVQTNGSGATYFPGDVAGTVASATFGVYA